MDPPNTTKKRYTCFWVHGGSRYILFQYGFVPNLASFCKLTLPFWRYTPVLGHFKLARYNPLLKGCFNFLQALSVRLFMKVTLSNNPSWHSEAPNKNGGCDGKVMESHPQAEKNPAIFDDLPTAMGFCRCLDANAGEPNKLGAKVLWLSCNQREQRLGNQGLENQLQMVGDVSVARLLDCQRFVVF